MIIQNILYLSKFCKPCPLRAYPLVRKMSYLNSDGLIPDSPGKPRFGKIKIMLMVCWDWQILKIMLTFLGFLRSHFGINDCKKYCLFTWRFWCVLSRGRRRLNSFKVSYLHNTKYSLRNCCSVIRINMILFVWIVWIKSKSFLFAKHCPLMP